jgi:hypothetical protein
MKVTRAKVTVVALATAALVLDFAELNGAIIAAHGYIAALVSKARKSALLWIKKCVYVFVQSLNNKVNAYLTENASFISRYMDAMG